MSSDLPNSPLSGNADAAVLIQASLAEDALALVEAFLAQDHHEVGLRATLLMNRADDLGAAPLARASYTMLRAVNTFDWRWDDEAAAHSLVNVVAAAAETVVEQGAT